MPRSVGRPDGRRGGLNAPEMTTTVLEISQQLSFLRKRMAHLEERQVARGRVPPENRQRDTQCRKVFD